MGEYLVSRSTMTVESRQVAPWLSTMLPKENKQVLAVLLVLTESPVERRKRMTAAA